LTHPDPTLVDEIFAGALELEREERDAYVNDRCGEDAALKDKVVALLRASEVTDEELAGRLSGVREQFFSDMHADRAGAGEHGEDLSGLHTGAWRLKRRIARGGLATVYLAHRADGEYEQRAAFKVLRRGLDTDDLVARFRAERQILSALDHPAIAGILDGGALEDGRPYLVLEFVEGRPIDDYCTANAITIRGRIRLMIEVLRALHHAHRHLIVHRDIKPSNILVSNEGHVTLLDFGIAKLLEPDALPGASTMTRTGVSLLTPGYCSPEQYAGEPVTTASDIYQAGAVLYELLTGSRPRLAADRAEAAEPLTPSRALARKSDRDAVRGDLDAIVNKATHPDPTQRYASADEMVADLGRYLDGRPVIARPDTLGYRLGKFNRRRPWAIPAIAAAILAIGGYVWTLTTYNEQLRTEQRRASAAQTFLVDILSSPDPFQPADAERGRDITVVEALGLGAQRLDTELDDDPVLKASLLASIAGVYASLDQADEAIALRERALKLERDVFGEESEEALASLRLLVRQYLATGDYDRATRYADRLLEIARLRYADNAAMLGSAEATAATAAAAIGDFEGSVALYESAIPALEDSPDADMHTLLNAMVELSERLAHEDPDKAFGLLERAEALMLERYDPDSLPVAQIRSPLASIYSAIGHYDQAEAEFLAVLPVYETHLGETHSQTLATLNNLGLLYTRAGRYERAEAIYRDVLEKSVRNTGEMHRGVADVYQNLATAITRSGRYAEAIPMHQKAYEIYKATLPVDQAVVAYPLLSKAYAEINSRMYDDAEITAREALDILERTAEGTYLVGVAQCLVGLALEGQGHTAPGQALLEQSYESLVGSRISGVYREACRVPGEPDVPAL